MSWQAVKAVIELSRAKGSAHHLLMVIAYHADKEGGNSFPDIETLVAEARLCRKTVYNALHDLVDMGELILTEGRYAADQSHPYTLGLFSASVASPVEAGAVETAPEESVNLTQESVNLTQPGEGDSVNLTQKSVNVTQKSVNLTHPLIGLKSPEESLRIPVRNVAGAGARASPDALVISLYEAAKGVLDHEPTSDQRKLLREFYDHYGGDPRLTVELIDYAREVCAKEDKKSLAFWRAIMKRRLDDPAWVSVRADIESKEQTNGRANGRNGHGHGHGHGHGANGRGDKDAGRQDRGGAAQDPSEKYFRDVPPGFDVHRGP